MLVADPGVRGRLGRRPRSSAARCESTARGRHGHAVKVLIVSGIWPPDVGGPASHAPELAAFLLGRGHAVEVVTTADAPPAKQAYEVRWVDRAAPAGVRHARVAAWIRERAIQSDVVYATSMLGRAVLGPRSGGGRSSPSSSPTRRTSARGGWGLFDGDLDAFQRFRGGVAGAVAPEGARPRAPSRESPRLPERLPRRTCRRLGSSKGTSHGATERRATAPFASRSRRGSCRARGRRADARVRREGHEAEVAGGRARCPRPGRRRLAAHRRRRARSGGGEAARSRARPRRPRSVSRVARAQRRAHALSGCRRVAPHVVVGELPAHGRRGARRRDAGDRDTRRRSSGAGARRRERPARRGRRH